MSSCRKANAAIERAPGQNPQSRLIDEAHAGEIIVLAKAGMRSRGPLSQPDVLLEAMQPSELEAWESSPLLTERPER